MYQKHHWHILPVEKVFPITSDTQTIDLSDSIPDNCRKIKVFISCHSGSNPNQDEVVSFAFGTLKDKILIEMNPYHQDAWSSNSSNETLNIEGTKEIQVKRQGNFGTGGFKLTLKLIGYK